MASTQVYVIDRVCLLFDEDRGGIAVSGIHLGGIRQPEQALGDGIIQHLWIACREVNAPIASLEQGVAANQHVLLRDVVAHGANGVAGCLYDAPGSVEEFQLVVMLDGYEVLDGQRRAELGSEVFRWIQEDFLFVGSCIYGNVQFFLELVCGTDMVEMPVCQKNGDRTALDHFDGAANGTDRSAWVNDHHVGFIVKKIDVYRQHSSGYDRNLHFYATLFLHLQVYHQGGIGMNRKSIGKYIALILRHKPEVIGITLDAHGWADVDALIKGVALTHPLDREGLELIVATDEKQRYSFNEDHTKIRANQGHSLAVDVELEQSEPPIVLYHGTGQKSVASIDQEGLLPGNRQYVHLSLDRQTAVKVGQRHGRPFVYTVLSGQMHRDGYAFYLSRNGVWLAKSVPARYLKKS